MNRLRQFVCGFSGHDYRLAGTDNSNQFEFRGGHVQTVTLSFFECRYCGKRVTTGNWCDHKRATELSIRWVLSGHLPGAIAPPKRDTTAKVIPIRGPIE